MTWAKLDDDFPNHEKVWALSDAAFRVHVAGICMCARLLTDGFVAESRLAGLTCKPRKQALQELVDARMWKPVKGGWMIHAYLDYNPSAEKVKADREAARERQERSRQRRHGEPSSAVSHGVTDAVTNGVSHSDPTRPDPNTDVSISPNPTVVGADGASGEGFAPLIERLTKACKGRNRSTVSSEASIVIDHLSRHVDRSIIDQAIGYAEASKGVVMPRWLLSAVRLHAPAAVIPTHPLEAS